MNSHQDNTITSLFNIRYPIIQGGMVWVSGGKLAAAVANTGCLGLIGAGSMKPNLLRDHIIKAKSLTHKNSKGRFGVNIPLLYSEVDKQIDCALELGVKIFFTSAGDPKKWTSYLKDRGALVVHVTSSPKLALKCEKAGVDAVVAEGFEAGGHNGREESTTMTLIPQVRDAISIPLIAAGGIYDQRQLKAAICLGADGVQIGSGFAATQESSAHENFKDKILKSRFGDTRLMMKGLIPVRLLENNFSREVLEAELKGALPEELTLLLGKGRARRGMLEGDAENGELEIGQVSSMISHIPSVYDYVQTLTKDLY